MKHDETPGPSADDKPNDTEGHGYKWADAETPEGEDVEGHGYKWADAETPEGGDDTEGHVYVEGPDQIGNRPR